VTADTTSSARQTPPAPPGSGSSSRGLRWLIPAVLLLVWLALGMVGGPFQGKLAEVQTNDASSFLPDTAESSKVSDLQQRFTPQQAFPAFLLIESDTALTPEQLKAFTDFAQGTPKIELPVEGSAAVPIESLLVPGPVPVVPSQDGKAALALVNFDIDQLAANLPDGKSAVQTAVEAIRDRDAALDATGVKVFVAGPAGGVADLVKAFGGIDERLLQVTFAVVLLILLVVYRSPVIPVLVLLSAVMALAVASVLVYVLADQGVITLDGQGQGILFILVVGAATDYALLLVARYREELRRHDDRYDAMRLAWRRTLEPVVASAGTVILGLLCLLLSDIGSTKSLGPVGAIGIAAAVLAAMTFLPAVLVLPGVPVSLLVAGIGAGVGALTVGVPGALGGALLGLAAAVAVALRLRRRARSRRAGGADVEAGRWIFWPAEPHVGSQGPETRGIWAKVASLVGRRPRRVWVLTALALVALAAFLPTLKAGGIKQSDVFLTSVESVTGGEALGRHFPAGSGSPTTVIGPEGRLDDMVATVRGTQGVASVVPLPATPAAPGQPAAGPPKVVDGQVELQVTLSDPADSLEADQTVQRLREGLDAVGPEVLVGGETAQNLDIRQISARDRNLIIPVILLVIFVVLALLLRALVAPLILIVANVLSFAATLGTAALVFNHVFDFPGSDPSVSLYGFVFLVALGIDYSIFLMTRVREESIKQGTRPGILTGLAVTGGVITSAGIVLAATFAALGVLPILFLAQIAFIVAFGVLLDTLVVRSLLVPALAHELGRWTWWPSKLARTDGGAGGEKAPKVEAPVGG